MTSSSRINTTYTLAANTTQNPPGDGSTGTFNSSEASVTAAISSTSSVPFNSSHAPQGTHTGPYTSTSSTVELPLPTTTCCKKCLIFISRLHSIPRSRITSQSSSHCVIIEKSLSEKKFLTFLIKSQFNLVPFGAGIIFKQQKSSWKRP